MALKIFAGVVAITCVLVARGEGANEVKLGGKYSLQGKLTAEGFENLHKSCSIKYYYCCCTTTAKWESVLFQRLARLDDTETLLAASAYLVRGVVVGASTPATEKMRTRKQYSETTTAVVCVSSLHVRYVQTISTTRGLYSSTAFDACTLSHIGMYVAPVLRNAVTLRTKGAPFTK